MAQTFEIRFERNAGLASFFAAAENSFRWKGAGRLSIDSQGISIAKRRGLASLFSRHHSHRISAADLKEVYREGAALRMEFQAQGRTRTVLPFWTTDRDIAAEIVRLMPTTRTVELEQGPTIQPAGQVRVARIALLAATLGVAAILAAAWNFTTRPVAGKVVATPFPAIEPAIVTIPVDLPNLPDVPLAATVTDSDHLDLAIKPGTAAFATSQRHITAFEQQASAIDSEYRAARLLMTDATITPEEFAARLDGFEMRWWDVTFRVLDNNQLSAPELLDLRAAMLGIARHWRNFLSGYATGLRKHDHVMIAHSFDSLTRAEEMRARVRMLSR